MMTKTGYAKLSPFVLESTGLVDGSMERAGNSLSHGVTTFPVACMSAWVPLLVY